MSEDELIKAHDETNLNRALPSTYFLDELRPRDAARAEAASYNLAKRVMWLTIVNAVFAALAVIAAVVAIMIA